MKILLVHNFYSRVTGEDQSVLEHAAALRSSGLVEVSEFYFSSEAFRRSAWPKKIAALLKGNLPFLGDRDITKIFDREKPDLVEIHNLTPLIHPRIVDLAKARKIPIAIFAHSHRPLCPRGTSSYREIACDRCAGSGAGWAILRNCLGRFHESVLYAWRHGSQRCVWLKADVGVVPSFYARDIYKRLVPETKIVVLGEYLDIPERFRGRGPGEKDNCLIYAGRLESEKGPELMIEAALAFPKVHFKICGEGSLSEWLINTVRERKLANLELTGFLPREELLSLVRRSRGLIVPSLCGEIYGRSGREAEALGVPVVTSCRGANVEWVQDGENGFLFDPDIPGDLIEKIGRLLEKGPSMERTLSKNALSAGNARYYAQAYLEALRGPLGRSF